MTSAAAAPLRVRVLNSLPRPTVCSICRAGIAARSHGLRVSTRGYAASSPEVAVRTPAYKQRVQESMRNETRSATVRFKSLQPELARLQDPVKLADHTVRLLRNGKKEQALELVRAASKDRQCTVSWNFIINDYMQAGKVQLAFHSFSEVSATLCVNVPHSPCLDAQAGPKTGLIYLHNIVSWTCRKRREDAECCRASTHTLQLTPGAHLGRLSLNNTRECGDGSLRQSLQH
jgi:hypothetical protein